MSPSRGLSSPETPPARSFSLPALLAKYCAMAVVLVCVLRFISGRPGWTRAWLYVACTLAFQIVVGFVLERVNPGLLAERSRIQPGTKGWDRILAPIVATVCPLAIWCVAAWDVRLHWPPVVPVAWSAAAFGVCILGFLLTFWAMAKNPFFSATVRIQSDRGHTVIDSGPYQYLRHPGYTGALAFSLASPIALGSWLALIPAGFVTAVLVVRTVLEDRTLSAELDGYRAYTRRVRHRLIPGLW